MTYIHIDIPIHIHTHMCYVGINIDTYSGWFGGVSFYRCIYMRFSLLENFMRNGLMSKYVQVIPFVRYGVWGEG